MSKAEFTSLTIKQLKGMTAIEIWQFIVDYFKSINDNSEDEHLAFIKKQNLDKIKDEKKAWKYICGVYVTYAYWE